MTDLDLVSKLLSGVCVSPVVKGEVPGSSHDRWILLLEFAVKQTSLTTLAGGKL